MIVANYVEPNEVSNLRKLPCDTVLLAITTYLKEDRDFHPIKSLKTRRWHFKHSNSEFEMITNGEKWFNTRTKQSGAGAIDLVMYLDSCTFMQAIIILRQIANSHTQSKVTLDRDIKLNRACQELAY